MIASCAGDVVSVSAIAIGGNGGASIIGSGGYAGGSGGSATLCRRHRKAKRLAVT
jgi:hypothetical protein